MCLNETGIYLLSVLLIIRGIRTEYLDGNTRIQYEILRSEDSYSNSTLICASKGMKIAVIPSQKAQTIVHSMATKENISDFWISSDNWTNWENAYPKHSGKCSYMYIHLATMKWRDESCTSTNKHYIVCSFTFYLGSVASSALTSTTQANGACLCHKMTTDNRNITSEEKISEAKQEVKQWRQELIIQKKDLIIFKSKKGCRTDGRTSSKACGYVAGIILIAVLGLIVLMDISSAGSKYMRKFKKRRERLRKLSLAMVK